MPRKPKSSPDPEHEKLLLLDRLEELLEDLQELGINSVEELRERIAALEAEIDEAENEQDDDGPV